MDWLYNHFPHLAAVLTTLWAFVETHQRESKVATVIKGVFRIAKPVIEHGEDKVSVLSELKTFIDEAKEIAEVIEKDGLVALEKINAFISNAATVAKAVAPLTGSHAPEVAAGAEAAQTVTPVVAEAIKQVDPSLTP